MEINHENFQKICLLLKEDYKINGRNDDGVILVNTRRTTKNASTDLQRICHNCGSHTEAEGNCEPEVEDDTTTAEIYAKIE